MATIATNKTTSTMIGGFSKSHLLNRAGELVSEKTKATTILDEDAMERMPQFDIAGKYQQSRYNTILYNTIQGNGTTSSSMHTFIHSFSYSNFTELTIGRVLGRGGFCVVSEIKAVHLSHGEPNHPTTPSHNRNHNNNHNNNQDNNHDHDDEHQMTNLVQDRAFMQRHYLRKGKDTRYAIKRLKSDVEDDAHIFINGIVDLAIEAKFLAVIRHPNIIKMRALACKTSISREYFLVLDRLYDILSTRLISWKRREIKGIGKLFDRKGKRQIAFWLERITVAYDLSCALKYLHGLKIVYRDLKPDNIGFDVRGDVKIFDFVSMCVCVCARLVLHQQLSIYICCHQHFYPQRQSRVSPRSFGPTTASKTERSK